MDPSCSPILVNDRAGALHNTPTPQQIQELAQEVGLNAEVIPTTSAEHMRQTLRRLVREGYPKPAVVGGDGTVALAAPCASIVMIKS
jgi:diacylglycerol kinase family enzyme